MTGKRIAVGTTEVVPCYKAEPSEEEVGRVDGAAEGAPLQGQQIPRGLNSTPPSAKEALVGDPGSPARDDKIIGSG